MDEFIDPTHGRMIAAHEPSNEGCGLEKSQTEQIDEISAAYGARPVQWPTTLTRQSVARVIKYAVDSISKSNVK